ncbi:MAG: hypothetical protein Q8L86_03100 [Vicinamibacterales bacterium]|nr:hypothetical protein [Vicinamibacterales bacterium]
MTHDELPTQVALIGPGARDEARAEAARWQKLTDDELVGLVGFCGHVNVREGASAELQRRFIVEFRRTAAESGRMSLSMLRLAVMMTVFALASIAQNAGWFDNVPKMWGW